MHKGVDIGETTRSKTTPSNRKKKNANNNPQENIHQQIQEKAIILHLENENQNLKDDAKQMENNL